MTKRKPAAKAANAKALRAAMRVIVNASGGDARAALMKLLESPEFVAAEVHPSARVFLAREREVIDALDRAPRAAAGKGVSCEAAVQVLRAMARLLPADSQRIVASRRELALEAGVDDGRVDAALPWLVAVGAVILGRRGMGKRPSEYELDARFASALPEAARLDVVEAQRRQMQLAALRASVPAKRAAAGATAPALRA